MHDAMAIFRFFGDVCIQTVSSRGFKCSVVTRRLQ